jgi:DNA-binding NarL/FixJ family response regulator
VEKAQELQPDLILMDIGLPGINGIEAARRIRTVAPNSKIIFLTQESSLEAVQEAKSLGASGYVLKIDAETDLLTAVQAVLQGKQFFDDGAGGLDC